MPGKYSWRIDDATFRRMQIVAKAAGIPIKTKRDVHTIVYLADIFRGLIRLSRLKL
jgi:hypothetical protein